jgi:hypothetical protein
VELHNLSTYSSPITKDEMEGYVASIEETRNVCILVLTRKTEDKSPFGRSRKIRLRMGLNINQDRDQLRVLVIMIMNLGFKNLGNLFTR